MVLVDLERGGRGTVEVLDLRRGPGVGRVGDGERLHAPEISRFRCSVSTPPLTTGSGQGGEGSYPTKSGISSPRTRSSSVSRRRTTAQRSPFTITSAARGRVL